MKKIMVVEDDPVTAAVMTRVLEQRGFEVHAKDGRHGALALAQKIKADIVILDVLLPDGIGFEVSREIRRDPELYGAGILFVSAVTDKQEIDFAFEQGGDAYLTKPITKTEFCKQIDYLQSISDSARKRCPVTNLASLEAIRRRTNHHIFRGEPVALCCMEVSGLKAYRKMLGAQAVEGIIARAAEGLKAIAQTHDIDESLVGHVGAGYYMMVLPGDNYEPICREIVVAFDEVASEPEGGGDQRLFIGVAVTDTQSRKYTRAKEMIDDLNRMLRGAAPLECSTFIEAARHADDD